jgi:PAS domain S-box-containing protein
LDAPETPRAVSFCGHVVATETALVVNDALEDARFADNPLVTGEPRVRFYAGTPLKTPDGFVLGSLCAIDHSPKRPSPRQLELLSLLAGQVVDQLEARRERLQLARQRKEALESARRIEVLFNAMAEGVVLQDRSGAITRTNRSAELILGLSVDQLSGLTSSDPRWRCVREDGTPFPGDNHPAMVALRTGEACRNVVMGVHKPAGELTWISINSLPLHDPHESSPHAVVTTFHDISVLKAAQAASERVARQEHLITTGTLAAGVGHEINNPLAFVLANLEFCLEEVRGIAGGSPSGRLRELAVVLSEAREGAERIRKIVRGLRALAREESELLSTDVESAVEISLNMAAHETRHRATVVKALSPTPLVMADDSRLMQVLVNLIVNAAQSFADSDLTNNRILITSSTEPEGRVSISVQDNGPGIPAELRRRVFDPFFTTKPVGVGTGLGLSISQNIVHALGGELILESEPGRGTTFTVVLRAAPQPQHEEPGKDRVRSSARGRGRVLVIDDEPAILSIFRRVLQDEHELVTLNDAREAAQHLRATEGFDVVFCDLMMPHLNGPTLYARVREQAPALAERFVFVTGGATSESLRNFLAEVPNERMEKPFNIQNLRGIVRRFVNARRAV